MPRQVELFYMDVMYAADCNKRSQGMVHEPCLVETGLLPETDDEMT